MAVCTHPFAKSVDLSREPFTALCHCPSSMTPPTSTSLSYVALILNVDALVSITVGEGGRCAMLWFCAAHRASIQEYFSYGSKDSTAVLEGVCLKDLVLSLVCSQPATSFQTFHQTALDCRCVMPPAPQLLLVPLGTATSSKHLPGCPLGMPMQQRQLRDLHIVLAAEIERQLAEKAGLHFAVNQQQRERV